jgi:LacI family transcriptional regulator
MQYLFAVFKRELGCSPREYQQRVAVTAEEAALQA